MNFQAFDNNDNFAGLDNAYDSLNGGNHQNGRNLGTVDIQSTGLLGGFYEEFFWQIVKKYDVSILRKFYNEDYYNTKKNFLNRFTIDLNKLGKKDIEYSYVIPEEVKTGIDGEEMTMEMILDTVKEKGLMKIINNYKDEMEFDDIFFEFISPNSKFFIELTRSSLDSLDSLMKSFKLFYFCCSNDLHNTIVSKFSDKFNVFIINHIITTFESDDQKKLIRCFVLGLEGHFTAGIINSLIKLHFFNDWDLLVEKANLDTDFIVYHKEKLNIMEYIKMKKFSMEQLNILSENQGVIFWNNVMRYQDITEDFVIENEKNINIKYYSQKHPISESFINKYDSQVDWIAVLKRKNLSRDFLSSHKDKVFNFYFDDEVVQVVLVDKEVVVEPTRLFTQREQVETTGETTRETIVREIIAAGLEPTEALIEHVRVDGNIDALMTERVRWGQVNPEQRPVSIWAEPQIEFQPTTWNNGTRYVDNDQLRAEPSTGLRDFYTFQETGRTVRPDFSSNATTLRRQILANATTYALEPQQNERNPLNGLISHALELQQSGQTDVEDILTELENEDNQQQLFDDSIFN